VSAGVVQGSLLLIDGPGVLGQAQESVGSGAGTWWLVVAGLGAMTVVCGLSWLVVTRRTLPPAKQPYVPPDLPSRSERVGDPADDAAEDESSTHGNGVPGDPWVSQRDGGG